MTQSEIEHMWKVASNNPNHDTNWHDSVVVDFAKMVAAHALMNIDPSSFMSHQEGFEAGRLAERDKWMERAHIMILGEREACAKVCEEMTWYMDDGEECAAAIRARGLA